MSERLNHLLVLPRLRIQNANAISSPMTWGFPAMSAFIGAIQALERNLPDETRLIFEGVGDVLYRNNGDGTFADVSQAAGVVNPVEGRGLGVAIADYNNDGRPDTVITHLDSPLALLTNTTPNTGHYLVLRLVGTASSRDAIGATVTARAGERTWVAQLTAGDGYLVNNQRQLLFGTGPATRIDQLSISWPSGLKQDLGPVQTDQTLKIIEGRGAVVVDKKN